METAVSLALLLALVFTGIAAWLTGLFNWHPVSEVIVLFLVLMVAFEIVTAPLIYYRGFVLPHRYGISTQTIGNWLADLGKGGVLGLVVGLAGIAVVYWFLISFPAFWWILAWGLMLIVNIAMAIVTPVFLVPLFYRVKPLPDSDLKTRLEELAKKARAKVQGIYTLDFSSKGTAANAALMGIGRTRRIVVSDTLIQQYTVPEIEVVTSHEIGHHVNMDVYRLLVIQMSVWLVGFKVVDVIFNIAVKPLGLSIGEPAALPLLLLLFGAFGTVVSPLLNSYTRHIESQADEYALVLSDNPESFINAMTRLTNQNLGVAYPSRWEEFFLYDHPSYNKRVEHAKAYERRREGISKLKSQILRH